MNPFDLHGPEFLLFYLCLTLVTTLALWLARRNAESGASPKIDLSDPYLIAYLRGGENEVLRLAVVSLVDRGLLTVNDTTVRRSERTTSESVRIPLEHEVLKRFDAIREATAIFKDDALKSICSPYRMKLEQAGLLPDQKLKSDRWMRFSLGAIVLAGIGIIKVAIGISLERPVSILIIMIVVALIATALVSFPRLTASGRAMLGDIKTLYSGLKDRAHGITRGSATAEMMMFAAVFGVAALTPTDYAFARTLFPQASSSGGCGSSCGSSGGDGGGGGCGGGGCGGCGS